MTLLVAYARERLTASRLLPAVMLVVFAALAGRGWSGAAATAVDVAAALGLVIAFRVWDDVMDRERDRIRHPDRVVVRASSTAAFSAAAWIIAAGAVILLGLTRGLASVALLAAYTGILAASYGTRGLPTVALAKAGLRSGARDRILLLKYGVFTLALIGMPGAATVRGALAAAAAFVAACVYEWWHDAESPVFSLGGSR